MNGTVTDPSGAVVPSATITIKNIQTGVERQTTSDTAGRYTFVQVIPGSYTLNAHAEGFIEVNVTRIELLVNEPATVPVVFEKIGTVSQSIQVEASAVQVNTRCHLLRGTLPRFSDTSPGLPTSAGPPTAKPAPAPTTATVR